MGIKKKSHIPSSCALGQLYGSSRDVKPRGRAHKGAGWGGLGRRPRGVFQCEDTYRAPTGISGVCGGHGSRGEAGGESERAKSRELERTTWAPAGSEAARPQGEHQRKRRRSSGEELLPHIVRELHGRRQMNPQTSPKPDSRTSPSAFDSQTGTNPRDLREIGGVGVSPGRA